MKNRMVVVAATVLGSWAFAAPAFAVGQNPSSSCGVGFEQSTTTQFFGGIGNVAHDLGFRNVGEPTQLFHAIVKGFCQP